MSTLQKTIERFQRLPSDFTYDELRTMLRGLGYVEDSKGKTSGSRVAFINSTTKHILRLHKPHPGNILKQYLIRLIYNELKAQGAVK